MVELGIEVGPEAFAPSNLASTVASTARSWATLASTVASMLGVGSTGTGAAIEQASTKIPKSTARTAVSFIPLPTGLSASNGILTA